MKAWPGSRQEVLGRLEELCNACRNSRAEFERICNDWTRLSQDALGPTYTPVQTMLYRFSHVIEDLEGLELAAIRAVQGKEYTEEDEDDRFDAIYDAMGKAGLSGREMFVFAALYLDNGEYRRIRFVGEDDPWYRGRDEKDEEQRPAWCGDTIWEKVDYHVPHKHTQKEVAEMLGITQGRVCQLAKSSREKMFKEIGWIG